MENGDLRGDEIVISGISGVYPNADSVLEFGENLYNKVDMVSLEPRWTSSNPEIPKHVGKITEIEKFDAQFFKVGYQQAKVLEPVSRKILEHAYGAIFDSGNTNATVKGKKIGVFIGSSFADFSSMCFYNIKPSSDFMVGGSSKSMLANRISYWVDGKGPSYCLDFSCASSAAALEKAYNSIKSGDCDAAVVGAANVCSHPTLSLNLRRAGYLCLDGKTKCFDKNADGYVRAEAVTLLFLQKAKDAKRIYAELYHAKGICALKRESQFLSLHNSNDIQKFLNDFYLETDVDPKEIEYIEANGAAIAEADANELDAIGKIFAKDKQVKVGCVKSNMGHSEAVSGLTAVAKMCLAYHKGKLPANLHFNSPHDDVQSKNVSILTKNAKFDRGYAAINNFSIGANFHIVLKGHFKEKNIEKYKSQVPRIVLASGREESCVKNILDSLKMKPIDVEEIALLHSIFEKDVVGHTGRGYAILDTNEKGATATISESVDYYSGVRRPLWFAYSGMGSQWLGMGSDLMRIPTFAKAIERCHKVLAPKGIDIVKILTDTDKTIFDSIVHGFVGIGAVQIGLTDILKEMGLEPDYIIGHSLGEMACAYHDNTFTADELILSTFSRGKAVLESNLVKGSMAAVGLGYKNLINQCPPEIDIGCHNSSESATISGPAEAMKSYVAQLTERGIFAREVQSANIAYHSRYMADAGPALLRRLQEVIKEPKLRSNKWISTSVPKDKWNEEKARYSSPEYHMNNMLSPVLFEEMIATIPSNAVIVEIAPHGLLQAILKRSHPEATHVPLTRRGCPDGVQFLLEAIGKLYEAGYNPKVEILYPKVEFPVSTETPLLSHLVKWEHTEDWPLINLERGDEVTSSTRDLIISKHDDDHKYITDHVINGVTTIPEAALLVYVWETLAMYKGADYRYVSVIFKDIEFHNDVEIHDENAYLSVMISKGNDRFEIRQDNKIIVSGVASAVKNITFQFNIDNEEDFDDVRINSEDVYKVFSMRGYSYKGLLKSIHSLNLNRNNAFIKWNDDWISFLDSLIQLNTVLRDHNGISKPKFIRKIRISVVEQEVYNELLGNKIEHHTAQVNNILGITRCAGVEIDNITYMDKQIITQRPDVLIEKSFFPYLGTKEVDMQTALEINLQVVADNVNTRSVNITYFENETKTQMPDLFNKIEEIAKWIPNIDFNTKSYKIEDIDNEVNNGGTNLLVLKNLLEGPKVMEYIHSLLSKEDYILTLEKQIPTKHTKEYFDILTCMSDGKNILLLLKKPDQKNNVLHIPVTVENFSWVKQVFDEKVTTKKIVLVSDKQPYCGLSGFVKNLKMDGAKNIAFVDIQDIYAQKFNFDDDFYADQLEKNLTANVLRKGQWGSYFYTSCGKTAVLRSFTLKNVVPGDLDKLTWIEAPPLLAKKMVQVCYSGLSVKDCQKATNNYKIDKCSFGMDFSGIDKNGDRVMGLVQGGSLSSSVEPDSELLWPVPENWSLEDAATVPLPYIHAYYCLCLRGKLSKGHKVLVTGGAGALGLAVISLCLAYDCTVFTTVSSLEKKKIVLKLYSKLNDNNICYSNHDDLFNMVMMNTKRQGCDLVISCATGIIRETAMKCVGFTGLFLDVSKQDMFESKNIGMAYLNNDTSYVAVDVSNIFKPEFAADKKILQKYLKEGINSGIVTPLPRVVYSPPMVSRAFKLLSLRRNRGRVLLRIRDPIVMNQGLNVLPRLVYTSQDVVIVICDEKGVGIELADRLIDRGAKKIILHMKPSLRSGYLQTKFISWSKHEVSVKLSSENLHTELGCASLMKIAGKFGKVKGFFIVEDTKNDRNLVEAFNERCKVVMNLDVASRNCGELSSFVIVSQSTQSASDDYSLSLTERICELRNEMVLPALVIRHESLFELCDGNIINNNKLKPQSLSTFFDSLETSLKLKYKNILTFNLYKDTCNSHNIKKNSDFDCKMGAFYKEIMNEEDYVSEQTIDILPSLLNRNKNEKTIDPNNEHLIMLPGFDGIAQRLKTVAERIKIHALGIQLGPDIKGETFREIAVNVRKTIKIHFGASKFYIFGYSFGANIALELAALLENEGHTGVVFFLDSSPDALRSHLNSYFGKLSEDKLQNAILKQICDIMTKSSNENLKQDFENAHTFEEKIKISLKALKGVSYSDQFKIQVLESAYSKIKLVKEYNPDLRLQSKLVLIKGVAHPKAENLTDDYNLSKFSNKPVEIVNINSDHSLAYQDVKVSNIINQYLDVSILEAFKKHNLCNVYYTDS